MVCGWEVKPMSMLLLSPMSGFDTEPRAHYLVELDQKSKLTIG